MWGADLYQFLSDVLDHITAMGLNLAQGTCETSHVLLTDSQVYFFVDLQFSSHLMIDSA